MNRALSPQEAEATLGAHLEPGERVHAAAFGLHIHRPRWMLWLDDCLRPLGTLGILVLYPFAFATRRERWLVAVTDRYVHSLRWYGPTSARTDGGRGGPLLRWPRQGSGTARVRAAGAIHRVELPFGAHRWTVVLGPETGTPAEAAAELCARLLGPAPAPRRDSRTEP
ncbi:MAG: hypothetical protein HY320_06145 [Armatimonadetes bacterium]|nr:hypothetical protein [Armatimonadota bacterium]